MKYDKKIKEIMQRIETFNDEECQSLKVELQTLLEICHKKDQRLHKIIKLSDKQQRAILELNEELDEYKTKLEEKVEAEIAKRKSQENLLYEQSRLAMIAEMIDSVAHQWMQPLNLIRLKTEVLAHKAKKKTQIDPQAVLELKEHTTLQINHLVDTLNNFRDFFKPNQKEKKFSLKESIYSVLKLIQEDLEQYNIAVSFHDEDDFLIFGNDNEFKHILLNFITNSKYAFMQRNIQNRKIIIKIDAKAKKMIYQDNAGGIDHDILDEIFQKRTTTKQDDGSGIGLYMSQQIAKKHNGRLEAKNIDGGAEFVFLYEGL